jgi:hypothetical protein
MGGRLDDAPGWGGFDYTSRVHYRGLVAVFRNQGEVVRYQQYRKRKFFLQTFEQTQHLGLNG